jgi:hypothetical protein
MASKVVMFGLMEGRGEGKKKRMKTQKMALMSELKKM